LVAVSDSILVRFDYESERPVPLAVEHVAALEAFEGHRLRG
jgi:hypothetical protein